MEQNQVWQERAGRLFCVGMSLVGLYLFCRYALIWCLPFLFAAGIAWGCAPIAKQWSKICRLPRRLCACLCVALIWLLLGGMLMALGTRFVREAEAILSTLPSFSLEGVWTAIYTRLPNRVQAVLAHWLSEMGTEQPWKQLTVYLGGWLTSAITYILETTPTAFLNFICTVVASFYFAMDGGEWYRALSSRLPVRVRQWTDPLLCRIKRALSGYGRAVFLLFLLTFIQVFVGLVFLKRPYALLCALLIAAVDVLPILGTGTILLPWSVVLLIQGEPTFGLGMLVLYGIVTVVRQIAEPHLVGESLGLHPCVSLLCMVMGLRLLGFLGLFVVPLAVSLFWQMFGAPVVPAKKKESCKKIS